MSGLQFNLLPDSKLNLDKAVHTKRLVFSIATIVSVASLALLIIMLGLVGVQKKLMSDAGNRVDKASAELKKLNVDKIITVQNQLQALPGLHQKKHITSRIFTYLPKITPPSVSINQLDLDLTKNAMTLSGTADSQKSVNTFVDTLKFSTFTIGTQGKASPAFSSVVESGFSINPTGVGYTLTLAFDPQLFTNGLKDANGKVVTPQISVDSASFNSPLKSPSNTLFNSSQSSTGGK